MAGRGERLSRFQATIGYLFKDIKLLEEALTHPSQANESGLSFNNQRLEFLGDAVLELVSSAELFSGNPQIKEGQLTRLRSHMVREPMLHKWAEHVGLSGLLLYGKSVGAKGVTGSMLADAVEAVFGAVFMDGGYDSAWAVVKGYLDFVSVEAGSQELDPKTELQELYQAEGAGVPYYKTVERKGPDHAMRFRVLATWGDQIIGEAWGASIKEAEFGAARAALAERKKKKKN